jgi:hypothetical protein
VLGNANSDLTLDGGTFKVTGSFALDTGKTITVAAGGGALQVEPAQTPTSRWPVLWPGVAH